MASADDKSILEGVMTRRQVFIESGESLAIRVRVQPLTMEKGGQIGGYIKDILRNVHCATEQLTEENPVPGVAIGPYGNPVVDFQPFLELAGYKAPIATDLSQCAVVIDDR